MKFLKKLGKNETTGAKATGGGAVGCVVTNKVMPVIPFVKEYPKFHGVGTFLLGTALMDMKGMHDVGVGMCAVAGTDTLGKFVPMVSASGIGDDILETLADELADELEDGIEDDVSNEEAAMNGDDDEEMNGDDDEEMNGDDDYEISDDVSSPASSMNSI